MLKRLILGSSMLYLGYGITLVAGFAQLKVLSLRLSVIDLGIYFALQSAVALVGELAKAGFPLVFAHYVPRFQAEGRDPRPLAFWSLLGHLVIGLIFGTISLILALVLPNEFTKNLPFATLFFYAMTHYSLASSFILSARRPGLYSLLNSSGAVGYACLLLVFYAPLNLRYALLSGAASYLLLSCIAWLILRPVPGRFSQLREITGYWKYAIMTTALGPIFTYADRLIAAAFLSYEAVAIFGVARKIETIGRNILGTPLDLLAPESSYNWLTRDRGEILGEMRRFTRFYFLWGLAVVALIPLLGKPAILLVSSSQYLPALPYLLVLWTGATLGTLYYPYTTLARGVGNMRIFFLSDLMWTGTYLAIALSLTGFLGLWALAVAPLFASFFTLIFARTLIFTYLGENKREFWAEGIAFILASGLAIAGLINPWWAAGAIAVTVSYGAWAALRK
ncbi:MAG: lipopolysaccharide biosynthesis protein [candidate division WOR-3 bacterium]